MSSLQIKLFPMDETRMLSGKVTSLRSTLELRGLPLKGVAAKVISWIRMPSVHQSIALGWPQALITSGALYPSVPTNELVRRSATREHVSTSGAEWKWLDG